jgi:hypothetical protein
MKVEVFIGRRDMRTISIRRGTVVSLVLMLTLSMAACAANKPLGNAGSGNGHAVSPTARAGPGGSSHTVSPMPSARTAAQDLASFFTAARQNDTRVRAAAAMVNGGITTNSMRISQATADAVRAADPQPVAAAIPPGLDPTLLQPVLLVYSELDSRYMAMYHLPVGVTASGGTGPASPGTYRYLMRCLGNGAIAASRFPADLAALEKAASAAPPVTVAAPDSRAAAELGLRIADIREANGGCAGCGGQLATKLAPISWGWHGTWSAQGPNDPLPDGTIGTIAFHVSYQPDKGWSVVLYVC